MLEITKLANVQTEGLLPCCLPPCITIQVSPYSSMSSDIKTYSNYFVVLEIFLAFFVNFIMFLGES
jgi:hypothetical protein